MAKQSGQEVATEWANRLAASTAKIQRGVMNVTQSPTQKAAASEQKYLMGVQNGVGKWKRGLNAVSLQDWQKQTIEKGVSRIGQGAQAATTKMARFYDKLLPFQESLKSQVDSMPNLTIDDSINKMIAWTRGMAKFEK